MGGGTIPVPIAPKLDELVALCIGSNIAELFRESINNRGEVRDLFIG
jgi:hypothetical protein